MNKDNKCESQGLYHAWEDITPNLVYATYPPSYPPKQEKCQNCGLIKTYRERTEKWVEWSDGVERNYSNWPEGSVVLAGNDTTKGTQGSIINQAIKK